MIYGNGEKMDKVYLLFLIIRDNRYTYNSLLFKLCLNHKNKKGLQF